jgi:antitoxin component YwqK of YwqJK toxin-antitoxin module
LLQLCHAGDTLLVGDTGLQDIQKACNKLSQFILYITGIPNGDSMSETENGTLAKAMKIEGPCEVQPNRPGNEETEIELESDSPCTFAYSVRFKEEHGQVKEEITEEQGWIYPQIDEGEDQLTNEGEDLNVVEMKHEENLQVTPQVLLY